MGLRSIVAPAVKPLSAAALLDETGARLKPFASRPAVEDAPSTRYLGAMSLPRFHPVFLVGELAEACAVYGRLLGCAGGRRDAVVFAR